MYGRPVVICMHSTAAALPAQPERTLSTEEEVAVVRKQLETLDGELQHAEERLTRVLSASSSAASSSASAARPTAGLPPLAGRPPASPPLAGGALLPPVPRALDSSTGSASSADTSASGSAGDAPGAAAEQERCAGAGRAALEPQPTAGSSLGWIFRCVITTKAGRCIVNCAPHASAGGVRAGEGGGLAVGPLCRLLVSVSAPVGVGQWRRADVSPVSP